MFYITAGVYLFGAIFFAVFASGERQPWAESTISTLHEYLSIYLTIIPYCYLVIHFNTNMVTFLDRMKKRRLLIKRGQNLQFWWNLPWKNKWNILITNRIIYIIPHNFSIVTFIKITQSNQSMYWLRKIYQEFKTNNAFHIFLHNLLWTSIAFSLLILFRCKVYC